MKLQASVARGLDDSIILLHSSDSGLSALRLLGKLFVASHYGSELIKGTFGNVEKARSVIELSNRLSMYPDTRAEPQRLSVLPGHSRRS